MHPPRVPNSSFPYSPCCALPVLIFVFFYRTHPRSLFGKLACDSWALSSLCIDGSRKSLRFTYLCLDTRISYHHFCLIPVLCSNTSRRVTLFSRVYLAGSLQSCHSHGNASTMARLISSLTVICQPKNSIALPSIYALKLPLFQDPLQPASYECRESMPRVACGSHFPDPPDSHISSFSHRRRELRLPCRRFEFEFFFH